MWREQGLFVRENGCETLAIHRQYESCLDSSVRSQRMNVLGMLLHQKPPQSQDKRDEPRMPVDYLDVINGTANTTRVRVKNLGKRRPTEGGHIHTDIDISWPVRTHPSVSLQHIWSAYRTGRVLLSAHQRGWEPNYPNDSMILHRHSPLPFQA